MSELTFDVLKQAWKKLTNERSEELQKLATDLSRPTEIYIKKIKEDEVSLMVEFSGITNAVVTAQSTAQVKRAITTWMRKFSMDVKVQRSDPNNLIVKLSKELKISEAAISVFKRDPKSNKIKKYYKCVGGKKDGRKVADPNDCIGIPDFQKKMKFGMTKRAKSGQTSASKKRTQLTNIVTKRLTKANKRLKKARGF